MNYFSITHILIDCLILFLSLLITRVLALLHEEKLRATLHTEIKNELKAEQEKIAHDRDILNAQQEQLLQERKQWETDYQEKSDFVKKCYEEAKQAALNAKAIREEAKEKIVALEKRYQDLEQQLKYARYNIKRRKQQLNELKE